MFEILMLLAFAYAGFCYCGGEAEQDSDKEDDGRSTLLKGKRRSDAEKKCVSCRVAANKLSGSGRLNPGDKAAVPHRGVYRGGEPFRLHRA